MHGKWKVVVLCLPDPQSPRLSNGVSLMLEHRAIVFCCTAHRNAQHNLCGSSAASWALPKLQIQPRWQRVFLGTQSSQEKLCTKSLVWLLCASWRTSPPWLWGHQTSFPDPVVEKSVKLYVDPRDFSWKEGRRYSSTPGSEGV